MTEKSDITVSKDGISNPSHVKVPCPTCRRKGTVDSAKYGNIPMSYCDIHGNNYPQEICQTCNGDGWILKPITEL